MSKFEEVFTQQKVIFITHGLEVQVDEVEHETSGTTMQITHKFLFTGQYQNTAGLR